MHEGAPDDLGHSVTSARLRLDPGELVADLWDWREGEQRESGMQARQAPYGIAGLGECDERLGAEAFPDVAGGLCEQVTHGPAGVAQRRDHGEWF
jgi:hypothetical protein